MPVRSARPWLTVAAALGTMHALASLYWAAGGEWLVGTVGQWALDWRSSAPLRVGAVLLLIGLAKLAGAWMPWANERRTLPGSRGWRALSWAGAALLVLYGGANTLVANLALAGVFGRVDDVVAMRGHAWLWDPMFLGWGLALAGGLWLSRGRRAGSGPPRSASRRPRQPESASPRRG